MDCLTGYIGLRGNCEDETPLSGRYINDLPNISLASMNGIADGEQKNYKEFWESIEKFSIQQLRGDILVKKGKYFEKQTLLAAQNVGVYDVPFETIAASNHYRGIYLEMYDSYYGSVLLNHVQLYLKGAINSTIYVYNVNDGSLITSKDFTGSVGSNIIKLNHKIQSYGQRIRLFVCYDASRVDSISTSAQNSFPDYLISRAGKVSQSSSILYDNIDFDNESAGLVLNFNVNCDIDGLICQNLDYLTNAYWYLLGKNIMLQAMHSERYNKFTLKSMDEKKEMHDYYADQYDEQLKAALDSVELISDGICYSCDKKRTYKLNLP